MYSQVEQLPPCPEGGGARVLVGYGQGNMFLGYTTGGRMHTFPFRAVCCTQYGHMTQYADRECISGALEATRIEQQRLAEDAARDLKRQQKKGLF